MLANLLDLTQQGFVHLDQPLIITDYGCGQSKASNVLAMVVSQTSYEISELLGNDASYEEILDFLAPYIKEADSVQLTELHQVTQYGHITVQRYDIGIPAFANKLTTKADVVFCNDVFEHIPTEELATFIADLEQTGKYIVASISLRDAVNYSKLSLDDLCKGATKVDKPTSGITLSQDPSGCYLFSLHVSIFPPEKWQEILGSNWVLLSAQDYTACSALNYCPSENYRQHKRELIAKVGFADFIPFPTKIGSKYQNDPILFRRTAMMQPQKHIQKLNALLEYPDSTFKNDEASKSKGFLAFLGAKLQFSGVYAIESLPDNWLKKLYALEALSKQNASNDAEVWKKAEEIISEYNAGNKQKIDNYVSNM